VNRNLLGPVVVLLLTSGGGALLASRAAWSTATASPAGLPEVDLSVTGTDVAPGAVGLALVVMAAAAGVLAAGPRLRRGIGCLVVAAAVGGIVVVLTASDAAARSRALDRAAVSGVEVAWSGTAMPVLAALAFGVAVVLGVAVAVLGPRWSTMGRRFEAPSAREADPADLWKAMDDGLDPTQ